MIQVTNGLKNSLVVLELPRDNEVLNDKCAIVVGTFTNCRESGLTFCLSAIFDKQKEFQMCNPFTWCVYEHRNTDNICINGKEGIVSICGELPYKSDDKYDTIADFSYNDYYGCAKKLAELILAYRDNELELIEKEKGELSK